MSVPILDMVAIVRSYLLEQPAVTDIVGEQISHKTPELLHDPWIRITLIDPRNETGTNEVEWMVSYYMQIDCYAGESNRATEAFDLCKEVRAALVDIAGADLEGAVATDVGFLSMPGDQDPDIGRERRILDCEIWAHPA